MIEQRIVLLNSGEYAKQCRVSIFGFSPFGWEFFEHPEPGCNFVMTYSTSKKLEESNINSMGIKAVIST